VLPLSSHLGGSSWHSLESRAYYATNRDQEQIQRERSEMIKKGLPYSSFSSIVVDSGGMKWLKPS
jgi:hypothetical protein